MIIIYTSNTMQSLRLAQMWFPALAPQKQQVKCSISTQNYDPLHSRRSAKYEPTMWSYSFVQSLQSNHQLLDGKNKDKVKELEEEVRCLMNTENAEELVILEVIYDIQRLGLGYRFEDEIKRAVDRIFLGKECDRVDPGNKLHAAALKFMLLRSHGYDTSQDAFKNFMDRDGNFWECHKKEVKGMLSLYEAAHLGVQGEGILDKALTFSRTHLNELKSHNTNENGTEPGVLELVNHALELPWHHRIPRLDARWYIQSYCKRKDSNHSLLELAKLDFNSVQSIYQEELKHMSRWWEELHLAKRLKFTRDRLTECFVWSTGMVPEPKYSSCRKGLTKVASFITIIDDIYDGYGTLEELELFTDAVERWDANGVDDLPDYLKLIFLALHNTVNQMAYDIFLRQGKIITPYLSKAWADLCKFFLQEARWRYNKNTPTFEEYLENATWSSSGGLLLVHAYFLLSEDITKDAVESLGKCPNLMRWPSVIFRICNDMATCTAEMEAGETTSVIHCYMRETGLSEDVARQHVRKVVGTCWKKMNSERTVDHRRLFSEPFVETACNLARAAQITYLYGDGHGAPDARARERVLSLLVEPIN